jgi:hypothetical protein
MERRLGLGLQSHLVVVDSMNSEVTTGSLVISTTKARYGDSTFRVGSIKYLKPDEHCARQDHEALSTARAAAQDLA